MRKKVLSITLALSICASLGVSIGAPAASAATGPVTAGPPRDYTLIKGLSQPKYETVREVFDIEMKDGIMIYVEVVRPKAPGKFGTILELSPYHGTLADRDGKRIFPGARDKDGKLVGLTGYFAPRGYAVVMADLRGTGRSQGCLDHMGPLDQQDAFRLVEWAAKQKWSNGRVGMTGHSYVGSTPSMATAKKPPHLTTIVPSAGLGAMYHHEFQNGVPYYLQWAGPLFAYEQLAMNRYLPPGISDPLGGPWGDNFGEDPQWFGCGWTQSAAVTGEAYTSGAEVDWHRERDWRKAATKADIPVFLIHGVHDNAARIPSIDWFTDRMRANFDKAWIGQWDHGGGSPHRPNSRTCGDDVAGPCPNDQYTYALHAWFDKWLLNRKVDTGPAVELFLNGGKVMTSPVWPPKTDSVILYPTADGKLATKLQEAEGSLSYIADGQGFNNEFNTGHVLFTSDKMAEDTAIVGIPKLHLVTSATAPRLHIITTMYDSDGTALTRIGRTGWAINPELRDGWDNPQPVIPTEKMTMDIDGQAQAYVLPKGHELVVRIQSSHPDKVPTFASGTQITVYFGGAKDAGTYFTLPVIRSPKVYGDIFGPGGIWSKDKAVVKGTQVRSGKSPRVRMRASSRYPQRGSTITFKVWLGACRRSGLKATGTRVVLKRQKGSKFEKVTVKRLDSRCEATFIQKANFKRATFKASWPKQRPGYRKGASKPGVIRTR